MLRRIILFLKKKTKSFISVLESNKLFPLSPSMVCFWYHRYTSTRKQSPPTSENHRVKLILGRHSYCIPGRSFVLITASPTRLPLLDTRVLIKFNNPTSCARESPEFASSCHSSPPSPFPLRTRTHFSLYPSFSFPLSERVHPLSTLVS